MKTLEQRVAALEELVQKIITLPHLSNVAGRDSSNFVARLKMSIASDNERLEHDLLTDYERKELEDRITQNERLVSPALDATLHDSATTESEKARQEREELRDAFKKMTLANIVRLTRDLPSNPDEIRAVRECFELIMDLRV